MNIDFPFQVGKNGRTASTDRSDHIRDLIRQVLFTIPGERVNRPTFGSGLHQLVFEPNSVELASTIQFLVTGALQQWLSDVIQVAEVNIDVADSLLSIHIKFSELGSSFIQEATFERPI